MKRRVFQWALGVAIVGVILAPVIIWSGKPATETATRDAAMKLPEVSTVGPEITPYELTPLERRKLALPAFSSPIPLDYLYESLPSAVVKSERPRPGMTPAELEKLAAWRARVQAGTTDGTPRMILREKGPISTIEIVPRAPGIEGMTPAERAKLEEYSKEGGRR
jgi:hypothetical protein